MKVKPNKTQQLAILHKNGPAIVIAGAGTGKTFVITERIIHLIQNNIAEADEILALTFTNKAAEEMSERIDKALPIGIYVDWILTFHSFCERILKHNAIHFDLEPDYQLINQTEAIHLFKENIYYFSLNHFLPSGNKYKYVAQIVQYFGKLQDELITPEKLLNWSINNLIKTVSKTDKNSDKIHTFFEKKGIVKNNSTWEYNIKDKKWEKDWLITLYPGLQDLDDKNKSLLQYNDEQFELSRVFQEYNSLKNEYNVLDFGDMVFQTIKLFEQKPNVLSKYREQFKYILVDEFQDTNLAQYHLMKILSSPQNNIMVVGDDDQSIYRFRGASISNILSFNDDFTETKKYVLTENYRSTQPILDFAYESIRNNNPNRLEIKADISKKLISKTDSQPTSISIAAAKNDYEEALFVIKEIVNKTGIKTRIPLPQSNKLYKVDYKKSPQADINSNITVKDPGLFSNNSNTYKITEIAILTRSLSYVKNITKLLDIYGIPYKLPSTQNLLSTPEVKFILSFLRSINDIYDLQSTLHLFRNQFISIPTRDFVIITQLSKREHKPILLFLEEQLSLKIGEENITPIAGKFFNENHITDKAITKIGKVFNILSKTLNKSHSGQNIEKIVVDMLYDFNIPQKLIKRDTLNSTLQLKNIERFIHLIQNFTLKFQTQDIDDFLRYIDSIQYTNQPSEDEDEYQNTDGINILTVHKAKGLEFKIVFLAGLSNRRFPGANRKLAIDIPDELLSKRLVENSSKNAHTEEERRLFYVALTRAKKHLYLSYPQIYEGNKTKNKPSLFINELGINVEYTDNNGSQKTDSTVCSFEQLSEQITKDNVKNKTILTQKMMWNIENNAVSYSQLQTYKECPYKFKLSYILKIPIKQNISLVFGSAVHNTLKDIFVMLKDTGKTISLNKAQNLLNQKLSPYMFETLEEYEQTIERANKALEIFYPKFYTGKENPILLERNFQLLLSNIVIRGKIDRLDQKGKSSFKLIDYKTGKLKDKKEVQKDLQLKLYAYALNKSLHIFPSELSLLFVEHGEEITIPLKPENMCEIEEELLQLIIPTVECISNNKFEATPSEFTCSYCNYKNICEYSVI